MSILLDGLLLLDTTYWLGTILTPTESRTTSSVSGLRLASVTPTLTTKASFLKGKSVSHLNTLALKNRLIHSQPLLFRALTHVD